MFWWHELINQVIGRIYNKKQVDAAAPQKTGISSPILMMVVYFIFINAIFGLVADYSNKENIYTNLEILMFKNWFFNLYLIFTIVEHIYLYKNGLKSLNPETLISANMIVLHVSIILGGIATMVVVPRFQNFFTDQEQLRTLLIIMPFLFLRYIAYRYFNTYDSPTKSSKGN
jgi:hypothetical protein